MRVRIRSWAKLDSSDLMATGAVCAYISTVVGIAMIYFPAALIAGGLGYLGLGIYRRWF